MHNVFMGRIYFSTGEKFFFTVAHQGGFFHMELKNFARAFVA